MRLNRILLVPLLVLALAFGAGGCAVFDAVGKFTSVITTEIKNPVTPKMLDNTQKGLKLALDGLNIYGNLCVMKSIDQSCWDVIEGIQVYTKQLPPILVNARKFVRENDQVNARKAYNAAQALLSDIRRESLAKGVI